MNKLFSYLFIGILLSVSTAAALFLSNYQEPFVINTNAQQATPTTTVLAKNLEVPWALGFLPDGNLLFTERTGKIKLLNTTTSAVTTITTIPGIKAQAESGLLGLAVHPQFATNNFVYIYYSYAGSGGTQNRVVRYVYSNNQFASPTTLIDGIPGNDYHNGGRLRFGPDGFLYITTGDGNNLSTPQDTNSLGGKILRVTDTGAAAAGNPFNNRVWSYGHRNPQGLAWNGTTLYATEHGPSQPSCCDELNRIEAGKNYGWPDVKGDETKAGTEKNLINSGQDGNNTWAPSGTTFYNGSVFMSGLRGQALYEFTVQGTSATLKASHFKNQVGRIRDVVVGPDNMLYIATGNKSAQGGSAKPEDDKILKVAFAGVGGVAPTTMPAPTNIVPTFGCVSNEPCTTAAPTSTATTPPGGGTNPITPPVGGANPLPGNPGTNPQPCPTDGTAGVFTDNKKKKKSGGGFIEQFIKFIIQLIELFLKMLGISIPNPGQNPAPQPNPNPENPGEQPAPNPGTQPCPEPTTAPEPTNPVQPTQSAAPTTAPTTQVQLPVATIPPATGTVPVGSKVVFVGNYDTGNFSQWDACQLKGVHIAKGSCAPTGNYSAAIVNDGAAHPTAMRYELRANEAGNGQRAEVLQDDAASVVEGDERWYEWSMKFDQSFQNPNGVWFIVMQWHSGSGSPPLAINISNSGNVEIGGDGVAKQKKTIGPVRKGQWVKYVLHVKFSKNASIGYVEAWENGVKTVQKYNSPTMSSGENYLKQGIYRDTSNKSTSILYHDDLRVTAP